MEVAQSVDFTSAMPGGNLLDEVRRMKYELTQELVTGNALIDSEHRQLFAAINDLLDACWFQAAHESRQAMLLGLQMGAAVAGAGPLRWEP